MTGVRALSDNSEWRPAIWPESASGDVGDAPLPRRPRRIAGNRCRGRPSYARAKVSRRSCGGRAGGESPDWSRERQHREISSCADLRRWSLQNLLA